MGCMNKLELVGLNFMEKYRRLSLLAVGLSVLSLNVFLLEAKDLEKIYGHYLQGDYQRAQSELEVLLENGPTASELVDMKKKLGSRALLEMSQNELLRKSMRVFNAKTWQRERSRFKSPRRIRFFIEQFMDDDGTRHKSMPNILAAGSYAVPFLLDYLKVSNDDVVKRGLAYQLLLNMGKEIVPSLLASTFSEDGMLVTSIVRLLGKLNDDRSIPYLLRLQEVSEIAVVREEVALALGQYGVDLKSESAPDLARIVVREVDRYLSGGESVHYESIDADGVLWQWNFKRDALEAYDPLQLDFEYQPQYPMSLWALLRAEQIHQEFSEMSFGDEASQAIHASTLCVWLQQEQRLRGLLASEGEQDVGVSAEALSVFLKHRSADMALVHWLGSDVLLQALDMSMQNPVAEKISARLLRMIAAYRPLGIAAKGIISYKTGQRVFPIVEGLSNGNEMVRYWSAIAIANCHRDLNIDEAALVVSLLEQAVDEIGLPTVLLMAGETESVGFFQSKLEGMGQFVVRHDHSGSGLKALSRYPSKDMVILDPSFSDSNTVQEFVGQLRAQPYGASVPLVVLSENAMVDEYRLAYQGQAQEMVLFGDSVDVLGEKLSKVKSGSQQVVGRDLAAELSLEALKALSGLDDKLLKRHPSLVEHLSEMLAAPHQPESSKEVAVGVLGKMGSVASSSVSVLLAMLEKDAAPQYKLAVLNALLSVSDGSERVRDRLYRIMVDPGNPESFRRTAATYLSVHQEQLSAEERRGFKRSFFTSSLGVERGG